MSIDNLETVMVETGGPDWSKWAERLAAFQAKAEIGHYRQYVAYSAVVANAERPVFIITRLSSGEVVASSLVRRLQTRVYGLIRLSVDRGPCLLNIDYLAPHLEALKRVLRNSGAWLRLNPYTCGECASRADIVLRRSGFTRTRGGAGEYNTTASIDLSRAGGEQWDDFRPSVRRQIRRAEKLDIEVLHDEEGAFAELFFSQCHSAAREKGYGLPGGVDALNVFRALITARPNPVLFVSRYEGRIVAGIALMPAGNRMIYEWGFSGTQPGDRHLPLSHRLHWEAMRWARGKGYAYYDLGGFWANRGEQDPINRFKLGFSPEIRSVLDEYYYPLSPVFGRLIEMAIRFRRRTSSTAGT